jgi:hypothetical protein
MQRNVRTYLCGSFRVYFVDNPCASPKRAVTVPRHAFLLRTHKVKADDNLTTSRLSGHLCGPWRFLTSGSTPQKFTVAQGQNRILPKPGSVFAQSFYGIGR